MGTRKRTGLATKAIRTLVEHPSRIVETLLVLVLALLIDRLGMHAGGNLESAWGANWALLGTALVAGLFGIWWVLQGQAVELAKGPLWVLPLVLYAIVQEQWLAPAPWRAAPVASLLLMAWTVYFAVAQGVRQRVNQLLLVGLLFVILNHWGLEIQGVLRGRSFEASLAWWLEAGGRATLLGPFASAPLAVAAFLVTAAPAAVIAGLPRFPGYVRLAAAGYGLFAVFLVGLAGNLAGYAVLLLLAGVVPLCWRPRWSRRIRLLLINVGGLVLLAALSYLFSLGVRERVDAALALQPPLVESARWASALGATSDAPLTGVGPGAYVLVTAIEDHWGPRSLYLRVLAEGGVIGLLLLVLAMVGTVGRLWRAWAAEPFEPHDREAEFRHQSEVGSPARPARRRRSGGLKRTSSRKVLLGATALSLTALALYGLFESSWISLSTVFLVAVLAGLGERSLPEETAGIRLAGKGSPVRFGLAGGALGLAFGILQYQDTWYAQQEAFVARRELHPYQISPQLAFENPTGLQESRQAAERSLRWEPGHGDALLLLTQAALLEEVAARLPPEEIAERALELARQTVEIYPGRGSSWYYLAEAQALAGLAAA
ncbi:MAG: O-antigen ligase family protein, partial [Opitutales bacterium]